MILSILPRKSLGIFRLWDHMLRYSYVSSRITAEADIAPRMGSAMEARTASVSIEYRRASLTKFA